MVLRACGLLAVFTFICGVIYPLVVTGIAQLGFNSQANGSIIEANGVKYGSELLGQNFTSDEYLWGRITYPENITFSVDEKGEVTVQSAEKLPEPLFYGSPSNLSPTTTAFQEAVETRISALTASDSDRSESTGTANSAESAGAENSTSSKTGSQAIPVDLVTASGSGLDPEISPAAAEYQVARIAGARNMEPDEVRAIIDEYTTGKWLGIFGEERVNVLKVNLALEGLI